MLLRTYCLVASVVLLAHGPVSAQSALLSEAPAADQCSRVQLTLDLKGKVTFQLNGKNETVEHQATAAHDYFERVLETKAAMAHRAVRLYQTARATIAGQTRLIRPERALMIADRVKDQLVAYSPAGPLLGEEMELTEHFDSLALPGLLPGREVKVGETWNVPPQVVQAICDLDALDAEAKQGLTCELKTIQGDLALVTIQGIVKGIQLGAAVSIHVDAKTKLVFDLKQKRIVELEWRQSDERQQGPVSPNLAADVTIKLQRAAVATPKELAAWTTAALPATPPAKLTNIVQRDAKGKFEFQHSREWQDVGEHQGQRVLKLVTAQGEYVADATIMPWKGPKIDDARTFQQQMEQTPGWEQEGDSKLDAAVKHPAGHTTYRISATGKLEGVPALRTAYFITAAGQQLLITFVVPPSQANQFAGRDLALVESVEFK